MPPARCSAPARPGRGVGRGLALALRGGALNVEAITARFGRQQTSRRVGLDFLAQTVNMRFQGMGGDRRGVAPDFAQQGFSADGWPAAASRNCKI